MYSGNHAPNFVLITPVYRRYYKNSFGLFFPDTVYYYLATFQVLIVGLKLLLNIGSIMQGVELVWYSAGCRANHSIRVVVLLRRCERTQLRLLQRHQFLLASVWHSAYSWTGTGSAASVHSQWCVRYAMCLRLVCYWKCSHCRRHGVYQ